MKYTNVQRFDYHLNEIQKLPTKMSWFQKQPKIYAGSYVLADGSLATYPDLGNVIGVAVDDVYDEDDTVNVLKMGTGCIVRCYV